MQSTDVLIVGGGIIGLATAYQLTRQYPGRRVVLLEKEPELAMHQSGRNSGVLHSGIYYRPGSLARKIAAPENWQWSSSARPRALPTKSAGR